MPAGEIYPLPFDENFFREVGKLFISGFEGKKAKGEIINALHEGLGGVILFPSNLGSPKEILSLTNGLRKAGKSPQLLIGIDQEGGRVARLKKPFTVFPPMSVLGTIGDTELARRVGQVIARELSAVGINLNFAPVMDIAQADSNDIIGDRSFGVDPQLVGKIGSAFIEGLQGEGVAGCAKHFPGHGATRRDSHLELPEILLSKTEMEPHIAPFKSAVEAGISAIMTAHIRCHALDKYHPATLSSSILTGLLRTQLGFSGVIITDDMEMKAVADIMPPEDATALALRAGADMILVCHNLEKTKKLHRYIHEAIRYVLINPEDVFDKLERISKLKRDFAPPKKKPPLKIIGCTEHQKVAREVIGLTENFSRN